MNADADAGQPEIFISYRRSDAGGHGRALHEYLSGRFGDHRVFFDRSTIESGDIFPNRLSGGVQGCAVLLALIGPEWLDVQGDHGGRRLEDAHDFVRREIALALELGKKVIPVLFDDTPVPPHERLPEPLKAFELRRADASREDLRIPNTEAGAGPAPGKDAGGSGACRMRAKPSPPSPPACPP